MASEERRSQDGRKQTDLVEYEVCAEVAPEDVHLRISVVQQGLEEAESTESEQRAAVKSEK